MGRRHSLMRAMHEGGDAAGLRPRMPRLELPALETEPTPAAASVSQLSPRHGADDPAQPHLSADLRRAPAMFTQGAFFLLFFLLSAARIPSHALTAAPKRVCAAFALSVSPSRRRPISPCRRERRCKLRTAGILQPQDRSFQPTLL